ncbi:MAG: 4Fe-4S binding protein [Desulfobacterales bacterium]|nr:4Fe-4S binding protein [Desulfobacterales bacterium]MDD4072552.1 4Fe-4S binding protein [Desulfobacterales bacterium]MDD4393821.1 4Fe-4S binding protein [Desulfobacterales bacterium]
MKKTRKIIHIDEEKCDGCGQCIPSCAEGALKIINGKARIVSDKFCDGLGACLGECPRGAITLTEREAEEFDEKAVKEMLNAKGKGSSESRAVCPSSHIQILEPSADLKKSNSGKSSSPCDSQLSHWPVKIRLIPPDAPFLKGADLVILADCAAVACPDLHNDFLRNHVVMTGCPKFDDMPAYIDKFKQIIKIAGIKRITVLSMEVPCCSGMAAGVKKAIQDTGSSIPLKEIIISTRGEAVEKASRPLTMIA